MSLKRYILSLLLVIETAYVCTQFFEVQELPYDDNYGLLIHCFIISLMTLIVLIVLWFKRRELVKSNFLVVALWTIIASPVTFALISIYYESIFGVTLAR